jgi:hypothetical protein
MKIVVLSDHIRGLPAFYAPTNKAGISISNQTV